MKARLAVKLSKNILCLNTSHLTGSGGAAGEEGLSSMVIEEVKRRKESCGGKLAEDPRTGLPIVPPPTEIKGKFPEADSLAGGVVHYFNPVNKVNKSGKELSRWLVISDNCLFLCTRDNGAIRRCSSIADVTEIIHDPDKDYVALKINNDVDWLFKPPRAQPVMNIVKQCNKFLTGKDIPINRHDLKKEVSGNGKMLNLQTAKGYSPRCQAISCIEEIFEWEISQERAEERKKRIAGLEAEVGGLAEEQKQWLIERSDLEHELSDLKQNLQATADQLGEKTQQLRDKEEASDRRISGLEEQVRQQEMQLTHYRESNLEEEHTQLQQDKAKMELEIAQLRSQASTSTSNLDEIREQLQNSKEKELSISMQLAELKSVAAESERELERLHQSRESLLEEMKQTSTQREEAHRLKIARIEKSNEQFQEDQERWQAANNRLIRLNNELIQERAVAMAEADSLRRQLLHVQHTLSATQVEKDEEIRKQREKLLEQNNELKDEVRKKENSLVDNEITIQNLQNEVSRLTNDAEDNIKKYGENSVLKKQVAQLEKQLAETQAALLEQVCVVCRQQKVVAQVGGGFLRYDEFVKQYGPISQDKLRKSIEDEYSAKDLEDQRSRSRSGSPRAQHLSPKLYNNNGGSPGRTTPVVLRNANNQLVLQMSPPRR